MTAPEPSPTTPPPADDSQGSLGAVLIGGAILVVAALLIFWPDGESASRTDGAGGRGGAQANADGAGGAAGGGLVGVAPRENDPAQGRVVPKLNPAIQLPTSTMAPPRPPKPEPTSFPSAEAEIAYYEKKLEEAQHNLSQRATFLERTNKAKENAKTPADQTRAESRAAIVQQNYDKAKQIVTDLETKLAELRAKQPDGAAG